MIVIILKKKKEIIIKRIFMRLGVGFLVITLQFKRLVYETESGVMGIRDLLVGINIEWELETGKWNCFDLFCCDGFLYNNFDIIIYDIFGFVDMLCYIRV